MTTYIVEYEGVEDYVLRINRETEELRKRLHAAISASRVYPAQCSCGHLFLEKFELPEIDDDGNWGFCWCGFCKTRLNLPSMTEVK